MFSFLLDVFFIGAERIVEVFGELVCVFQNLVYKRIPVDVLILHCLASRAHISR